MRTYVLVGIARGFLLSFCAIVLFAGCSDGGKPVAGVSGTVTFEGAPVETGLINLFNAQTGDAGGAKLETGGKYSIAGLPLGEYEVAIMPPPPDATIPKPGEPPPAAPVDPANIPKKYRDRKTSELKTTIKSGSNTFDVKMTP